MVATISGGALGLFNTSANTLGAQGEAGDASLGRSRERVWVNAANGNLVVQQVDDTLASLGLDVAVVRTYNSQGSVDGDNNDGWRIGVYQRVSGLTGTVNTAGSTVTKTFGDGTEVSYTFNATLGVYVGNAGDGAHDTLRWDVANARWTWTDGSSRSTERYNAAGQLVAAFDADGNATTYTYTGALITQINATGANGNSQTVYLDYTGNNLTRIRTVSVVAGIANTQTLTRYYYDASNRLRQVIVDLSPSDNTINTPDANADGIYEVDPGNTYVTTYAYSGTSTLLSSITQTDGTQLVFSYTTQDGRPRLTGQTIVTPAGNRTTGYVYSTVQSGGATYQQCVVTDAQSRQTTYLHDGAGRLVRVLSPAVGGAQLRVDYDYTAEGDLRTVVEDPAGLNLVTTHTYDASGNRLSTRDSAGNTVTRTYDPNNQLVTETRYLVRDPDGAGSGLPSAPLTTRYAYDAESHLRFVVTPEGRVTEYRYNSAGKRVLALTYAGGVYPVGPLGPTAAPIETELATWAAAQDKTKLERVDYDYDWRGQLWTTQAWNATDSAGAGLGVASTTTFVYDQRGRLLQTIEPRDPSTPAEANGTVYTYDGLGRVLTTTQWLAAGKTRQTRNVYDDVGNVTRTTFANGLLSTSTFNAAGELTSVVNTGPTGALGTTVYKYDAMGRLRLTVDPTGLRQHILYDEAGRKVGEVDGDGSLTEYIYDGAGRVIKTVRYAAALSRATRESLVDASGNPVEVPLSTLRAAASGNAANDRITRSVYNSAGQLVYTLDEVGAVTQFNYDGAGRLTDTVRYANTVTIARTTDQVLPSGVTVVASPDDRRTRYFYDNDGRQLGVLDGSGYLTETVYNAAGNAIQTIAYANASPVAQRASGTLALLRPALDNETVVDPERDAITYRYYNGQGQLVGELDAEGYLTETVYSAAGRVWKSVRYANVPNWTATATLDTLRAAAGANQTTIHEYDGAGRLVKQTNFEGTVTATGYDGADNVISVSRAQGTTDERTTQVRYDAMGRVLQELSAEGTTKLVTGLTAAQIEQVWLDYGLKHVYDLAGRRISTTDATNRKTVYYYDSDGRVRFTVNAIGFRTENRYNTLGQLTDVITYSNPVSATGLTGGLLTDVLLSTLTASASATDVQTTYTYHLTGQVKRAVTIDGSDVTTQYNAFGEVRSTASVIDIANRVRTNIFLYDQRGLLTTTRFDSTALNTGEARAYDAFGRLTSVTDARNNTTWTEYDRIGRVVATVDPYSRRVTTYDAFSRTVTTSDALNQITSYTYDDAARSVVMTTAQGVTKLFVHNRHGQDASAATGTNFLSWIYEANGNLQRHTDMLGTVESHTWDRAGREDTSTDGRGVVTQYNYDPAGRPYSVVQDNIAGGVQRTTVTPLTANGTPAYIQDPRTGDSTRNIYDRAGRLTDVIVDDGVQNLRTHYTYDKEGRTLTVIEGYGSSATKTTQYLYDTLGRRTEEIVDPTALGGTLNLRTQYRYDAAGNMTRKIDARGNSEWRVYDARNRLRQVIDALGNVVETLYDANDRVVGTKSYATALSSATLASFGDVVTSVSVTTNALDRLEQTVYDKDGRAAFSVSGTGMVTERSFNAAGLVTRTRIYANVVAAVPYATTAALTDALTDAGNSTTNISAADHTTWSVYDNRGRAVYTVNGVGAVQKFQYDGNGNVVSSTLYAQARPYTAGLSMTKSDLDAWTATASNLNPLADQTRRYWYDGAGRLRFELDGEGGLSETLYNDTTRQVTTVAYKSKPTLTATATLADVTNAATSLANAAADQRSVVVRDGAGRVVQRTDGEGYVTKYAYDERGNLTRTEQALDLPTTRWAITRIFYDAASRKVADMSAEGYLTQYVLNAMGQTTSRLVWARPVAVPAAGALPVPLAGDTARTTNYFYDNDNRLYREDNAANVGTVYTFDARGNVKTKQEGVGTGVSSDLRTTSYTYDAADRLIETTQAVGTTDAVTTRFDLDTFGNVKVRREAYGTTRQRNTTYSYDGANREILQSNDIGASTVTGYTTGDRVSMRAAPGSVSLEFFSYDRNNRLVSQTDGARGKTTTVYDAAGNKWKVVEANGNALVESDDAHYVAWRKRFGYVDAAGNGRLVANLTQAEKDHLLSRFTTTFSYDRNARLVRTVDLVGTVTAYTYDGAGNKRTTRTAVGVANVERLSSYDYDLDNRLKTVTDPMGGITRYEYDVLGNQTRITDANGGVRNNTFDAMGRVLTSTLTLAGAPGGGLLTTNTYDGRGNLKSTTLSYADGSDARVTTYRVDTLDRQVRITDAEGFSTSITYDLLGNQTRVVVGQYLLVPGDAGYDAAKAARVRTLATDFHYDAVGRMDTQTDGIGNVTRYEYETDGRRKSVIESSTGLNNAASRTTGYLYDGAGRVRTVNTAEGGQTVYVYDAGGNKISERQLQSGTPGQANAVWVTKTFEYDAAHRLTAQIDSYGNRTEFAYDEVGNLKETRYAAGTVEQRRERAEWDLNNRKKWDEDGYGRRTNYLYDKLGNRTKVTNALGQVARYYYDAASRLTSVLDADSAINTFRYDSSGNRTEERVYATRFTGTPSDFTAPTPSASSLDWIVSQRFDANNRLISRTDADQSRTDNTYWSSGAIKTETEFPSPTAPFGTGAAPRVTSYVYDANGRLQSSTDWRNVLTEFTYDGANNRLTEKVTNTDPDDPIKVRLTEYAYDLNNRRYAETFNRDGLNIVRTIGYDKAGNVTSEGVNAPVEFSGTALYPVTTYAYDLNNRKYRETKGAPAGETIATGWFSSAAFVRNTTYFDYDLRGNLKNVYDPRGGVTSYAYDLNNRKISDTLPSVSVFTIAGGTQNGVRPVIRYNYDAAGNLVETTDANGNKTTRYYDGNGRVTAEISGDDVLTTYTYDTAGNRSSEVMYMDRLQPSWYIVPSGATVSSVAWALYGDTNAAAALQAALGATPLTPGAYLGSLPDPLPRGDGTSWPLIRTALTTHNPAVRPTGTGVTRLTTFSYDATGRLKVKTLPAITVTRLSGTDTSTPASLAVANVALTERHVYDGWGNEVETYDRNDNRTALNYFDAEGRKVASLDAEGYYSEFKYDSQGNVVQQKVYTKPFLSPRNYTPATARPVPTLTEGGNDPHITDRVYDAASRMVSETGPQISVYDPVTNTTTQQRVTTVYRYDKAGQLTSKTVASGTAKAATEAYFYDAAGRRIAVIDAARVIYGFRYDANGNVSEQVRSPIALPAAAPDTTPLDLATTNVLVRLKIQAAADAIFTGNAFWSQAQSKLFNYDAQNRLQQSNDRGAWLDASGNVNASDDIIESFGYDAAGNRTRAVDGDNYVTQLSYDGANRVKQVITADTYGTVFSYDAAGNQAEVYSGVKLGSSLPPLAGGEVVSVADKVSLAWQYPFAGITTWVVYDSVSRSTIDAYANKTTAVEPNRGSVNATLANAATAPGSRVFYRIVSRDGAGNTRWTAEKVLTVPPKISAVTVGQTVLASATATTVSVTFDAAVTAPTLALSGSSTLQYTFARQGTSNTWVATIPSADVNTSTASYTIRWAADGVNYASKTAAFSLAADRVVVPKDFVPRPVVDADGVTRYTMLGVYPMPTTYANGMRLQAEWRRQGSTGPYSAVMVGGTTSGPYQLYSFELGAAAHLAAGTYDLVFTGVRADGSKVLLEKTSMTVGPGSSALEQTVASWVAPPSGSSQIFISGGMQTASSRFGSRVNAVVNGGGEYAVMYTDPLSVAHTVVVNSSNTGAGTTSLSVRTTITATEFPNVGSGGMRLAYRPAGTGTAFPNDVAITNGSPKVISGLAAGSYDLKVYYIDTQGREVIVEWRRVQTSTSSTTFSGNSQTVVGRESGTFVLGTSPDTVLYMRPTAHFGAVDPSLLNRPLNPTPLATGQTAGGQSNNGKSLGSFTQSTYDALNNKIAGTDGDGLYREYGVDGNGNVVETRLYGVRNPNQPIGGQTGAVIVTNTAYDKRNLKVATFGAQMQVSGSTTWQRPVERFTYDVLGNQTQRTDALSQRWTTAYNAYGWLMTESEPVNGNAVHYYDVLGNETGTGTTAGVFTRKHYDVAGNLVREVNTFNEATTYAYDNFGRMTKRTDGRGSATTTPDDYTTLYTWDSHDRLLTVRQAQAWHVINDTAQIYADERVYRGYNANATLLTQGQADYINQLYTTTYGYDKRGNRTSTSTGTLITGQNYGNGLTQRKVYYDAMGRVSADITMMDADLYTTSAGRSGMAGTESRLFDAYGNLLSERDTGGLSKTYTYGANNRVETATDESGVQIVYAYDAFGRLEREYDARNPNGTDANLKYIRRTYDNFGRVLTITDNSTKVSTVYTYDLEGHRKTEVVTSTASGSAVTLRNISYTYDNQGQLTYWKDAVKGGNEHIEYTGGRITRVYTDLNTTGYVNHVYEYDAVGRLEFIRNRTEATSTSSLSIVQVAKYGYDAAGNRISWIIGTGAQPQTWSYSIDANNRVASAQSSQYVGLPDRETWKYDGVGNVTKHETWGQSVLRSEVTTNYNGANLALNVRNDVKRHDVGPNTVPASVKTTVNTYDTSLRLSNVAVTQGSAKFNFAYSYLGDGREAAVEATGTSKGSSITDYDANKVRKFIDLDQGDGDLVRETRSFVADNEGHILSQSHLLGSGITASSDYFYANGNPMGEVGAADTGAVVNLFDSGAYALVKDVGNVYAGQGGALPGSTSTFSVRSGDTLMSIASAVYGNSSLWYVIADANGFTGSETLSEGATLTVPSTLRMGALDASTHNVYSEIRLAGSTLPNLKTPPPKQPPRWLKWVTIIVTVIIAVIVAAVTYGVGAAAAAWVGAALNAGIWGTVAAVGAGVVVGAAVATAGELLRQGILVPITPDARFNGKKVWQASVTGAISGAGAGVSGAAEFAAAAGKISAQGSMWASAGAGALEATAEVARQEFADGKITSYVSIGASFINSFGKSLNAAAKGFTKASNALGQLQSSAAVVGAARTAGTAVKAMGYVSASNRYATPWLRLQETYLRNDGFTPQDWGSAVAGTLNAAFVGQRLDNTITERLRSASLQTASNLIATGGISLVDQEAALEHITKAVGNEVGYVIGDTAGDALVGLGSAPFKTRTDGLLQKRYAERIAQDGANEPRVGTSVSGARTAINEVMSGQRSQLAALRARGIDVERMNEDRRLADNAQLRGVVRDEFGRVIDPNLMSLPSGSSNAVLDAPRYFGRVSDASAAFVNSLEPGAKLNDQRSLLALLEGQPYGRPKLGLISPGDGFGASSLTLDKTLFDPVSRIPVIGSWGDQTLATLSVYGKDLLSGSLVSDAVRGFYTSTLTQQNVFDFTGRALAARPQFAADTGTLINGSFEKGRLLFHSAFTIGKALAQTNDIMNKGYERLTYKTSVREVWKDALKDLSGAAIIAAGNMYARNMTEAGAPLAKLSENGKMMAKIGLDFAVGSTLKGIEQRGYDDRHKPYGVNLGTWDVGLAKGFLTNSVGYIHMNPNVGGVIMNLLTASSEALNVDIGTKYRVPPGSILPKLEPQWFTPNTNLPYQYRSYGLMVARLTASAGESWLQTRNTVGLTTRTTPSTLPEPWRQVLSPGAGAQGTPLWLGPISSPVYNPMKQVEVDRAIHQPTSVFEQVNRGAERTSIDIFNWKRDWRRYFSNTP